MVRARIFNLPNNLEHYENAIVFGNIDESQRFCFEYKKGSVAQLPASNYETLNAVKNAKEIIIPQGCKKIIIDNNQVIMVFE